MVLHETGIQFVGRKNKSYLKCAKRCGITERAMGKSGHEEYSDLLRCGEMLILHATPTLARNT